MTHPTLVTSWLDDHSRDRFWSKVNKNGPLPDSSDPLVLAPATPCWVWMAGKLKGYGCFHSWPRVIGRTSVAHRISYMDQVGGIPEGLMIDHLCRNRACVNPEHLEAVTAQVNQRRGDGMAGRRARKTHCPQGHPYDDANTRVDKIGRRKCRECHRARVFTKNQLPEVKAARAAEAREYRRRIREAKSA